MAEVNEIENARKILREIIHGLLIYEPFFGMWLARTWIYADPREKGISTDGIRIFVNPKLFSENFDAKKFIMELLHVVGHIVFKHVPRGAMKVSNEQDAILWHLASDAVLNREMFSDLALLDSISKATGVDIEELKRMRVEEVYDLLRRSNVNAGSIGQGQNHMRFNTQQGQQGQALNQPQQQQSPQSQQGNQQGQRQGQQQNQGNQSQLGQGRQGKQGQRSQGGQGSQGQQGQNNQSGGANQHGQGQQPLGSNQGQSQQGGSCNRQGNNPGQQGPGQQGKGGGSSQGSGQGSQQPGQPNQQQPQQGQQGQGSGEGGQGDLVPLNEGDPGESIENDIDADEIERKIDGKSIEIMGSLKYIGRLPAWAQRLFDQLSKPRIDWRDVLRAVLDRVFGKDMLRKWSIVNKHFPNERPGKALYGVDRVGILVDTSGSISDEELRQFVSEVYAVLSARNVSTVVVIPWDATAYEPIKLTTPSQISKLKGRLMGGGGTMIKDALKLAKKLRIEHIIILSDWDIGDINEPEVQKLLSSFRTIIAVTTHSEPVVPRHAIKLRLPLKPIEA